MEIRWGPTQGDLAEGLGWECPRAGLRSRGPGVTPCWLSQDLDMQKRGLSPGQCAGWQGGSQVLGAGCTRCKLVQPLWRTVWRFLKKLEIDMPYDPAVPLLGIHTEKTRRER